MYVSVFCRVLAVLIISLIAILPASSQHSIETYGKNRVQYRVFNWQYVSSDNFDVYYYDERRKVATEAIQYLESEFDHITDLIGYPPYLKTKVFLYNSVTDLQQSNMGIMGQQFNIGIQSDIIKPYVEIAHPGTLDEFKEELIYKVADLMVNEMMFGGSLKDMFQRAVLMNLPDWFIDGASLYAAKGWNAEMDDYVRQLVKSRRVNKALKLTGTESALVGQSIWNYIVERYGKGSVANILNYTRVIRNEQKSIYITLGIGFKQLIADWKKYYSTAQDRVSQSYAAPSDSQRFSPRHRKSVIYTTVKISPDGKNIAYAENDRGKFTVLVKSLENGKETMILSGGNKVFRQAVDYHIPLLSWSDSHTLGVIGTRYGEYIFWLYDLTTRSTLPRQLDKFSNIRSFNFSANGRLAVMSADMEGQNDLFLISSRRDRTRRLTNDLFDDFDPSFIPNTNTVIFSSNRTTDTTNTIVKDFTKIPKNYSLFSYNLDTTSNVVSRITNTLSMDFYPKALDENNFIYLSDQRGILNLFRFNRQTGVYSQVSNFPSSIKEYDIDFNSRTLAVVMTKDLTEDIFVQKNFNVERQIFTPATKRKETQQAKIITERRKKETRQGVSIKQLINERLQLKKDTAVQQPQPKDTTVQKPAPRDSAFQKTSSGDSLKVKSKTGDINIDNYSFDDAAPAKKDTVPAVIPSVALPVTTKKNDKGLNTDDYKFEDEAVSTQKPAETFLSRYMKAKDNGRITGPFPYQSKFSYENFATNFVVDPLRGFSIRLDMEMHDILENFRIFGGIQTAFDWKSGDVYTEFQYLKHRVDFSFRFDRKVIFWSQNDQLQKYSWQKIEFGAALPISVRTRVALKPFGGFTSFVDRGPDQQVASPPVYLPSKQQFYAGIKAEVVYDNSVTTGMNTIEGTRGKINFQHYEGLGNSGASFSQVALDLRHYQKIYKEIVFAVRGYAGTFFGNSPKQYVLGGVDNWFSYVTNYSGVRNPLYVKSGYNENLLFVDFATSLRGFDYATLYGTTVAMASGEFRLPLVRALASGPVTSNFFRNMQFTAFYDIGSSWTGAPPVDSQNTLRNELITQGPYQINLKQYLNPWLYSYGLGFRTMMLGYYLKFDYAWPVENYKVKDPRILVSLGFDF
ncbi:MAG TPA: translocation protein TolB [Cyclobacteriaceae bacterium]|nr:translocation protein TolB [Cyclobacteriaceae bacterium]